MGKLLESVKSGAGRVVEIFQYGVGYLKKNNGLISGLFTRNLNVCLGLVFETKQELIVMHLDTNVDTDSIAEQLKIIGTSYSLTIVSNQFNIANVMKHYPESFSIQNFLARLESSVKKLNLLKWNRISQENTFNGCFFVLTNGVIVTDNPLKTEKPLFYDFRTTLNFINYLSTCDGTGFSKLKLDLQYNFDAWTGFPNLTTTAKKLIALYKKTLNWNDFVLLAESKGIFEGLTSLLKQQPIIERRFQEYIEQEPLALKETIYYELASKKPFCDSFLIERLNQVQNNYQFFAVRDEAYKVDAVTFFNPESIEQVGKLKLLQEGINNLGSFYKTEKGENIFVLEGVNLSSEESNMQQTVRAYLKRFN